MERQPVPVAVDKQSVENCGGTGEVTYTVTKEREISHELDLGSEYKVSADGAVEVLGTGVDVGAEVAARLGVTYGKRDSVSRSISLAVAPKTMIEYEVSLQDIYQVGKAKIEVSGKNVILPFRFFNDFVLVLLGTRELPCPGTPTPIATYTPTPETGQEVADSLPASTTLESPANTIAAPTLAPPASTTEAPATWTPTQTAEPAATPTVTSTRLPPTLTLTPPPTAAPTATYTPTPTVVKRVIVRAEDVIPMIMGQEGELQKLLPWWREDAPGPSDEKLNPASLSPGEYCYGLAWNTNEYGYHTLLVFQSARRFTFADGGWYCKVCIPNNVQVSPQDVGEIMTDSLGKRYGIDNVPWSVRVE